MRPSFPARWIAPLVLLLPLLISLACNTATNTLPPTESSPTSPPTATPLEPPGELTLEQEMVFGPGALIFTDTQAGLATLTSYQAELILAFEGTRAGQASNWLQTYKLLASNEPVVRTWTIEKSGDLPDLEPFFLAEMNGLDYERRGELECTAVEIPEGTALSDRFELASFLTGVIGAEEAGTDRVNDLAAKHYTFDQRALGEEGLTEATGEMWIAAEGGYITRYLLTTKADADYFGEGIEGTLSLSYELTQPNRPVTIELPAGCPPGLVNAPLLPDATNVDKSPGLLSYQTTSSLQDGVDFYEKNLSGLGWEVEMESVVSDDAATLAYKQGNQSLNIFLISKDGKVTVTIALGTVSNSTIADP